MQDLENLKCRMSTCIDCSLHKGRKNIVFGDGNIYSPKLFIIGEAPGEEEDIAGKPFIGKAGAKLNQILAFAKIKREDIFISNSVICRPPNNRMPTEEEINTCRWRLHLQIKLINPKLLLMLGRAAMISMLGKDFKGPLSQFMKTDFMKFNIDGCEFNGLCSYHPSYHLRQPIKAYRETIHIWTRIKDLYEQI